MAGTHQGVEGSAQASSHRSQRRGRLDAKLCRCGRLIAPDRVGKVASEQMAREGARSANIHCRSRRRWPTSSDKVSVIIAPPSTNGDFIGASLLGTTRNVRVAVNAKSRYRALPGNNDKEGE